MLTHDSTAEFDFPRSEVEVTPLEPQQFTNTQPGCDGNIDGSFPRVRQFPEKLPDFLNKNVIGTLRIRRFAQSFILQVYDVWATHSSNTVPCSSTDLS
jgi:hypothetical protein